MLSCISVERRFNSLESQYRFVDKIDLGIVINLSKLKSSKTILGYGSLIKILIYTKHITKININLSSHLFLIVCGIYLFHRSYFLIYYFVEFRESKFDIINFWNTFIYDFIN